MNKQETIAYLRGKKDGLQILQEELKIFRKRINEERKIILILKENKENKWLEGKREGLRMFEQELSFFRNSINNCIGENKRELKEWKE